MKTRAKAIVYLAGLVIVSCAVGYVYPPAGALCFGLGLMADARTKEAAND